jgi:16S rRNA processing protein RimM
VEVQSPTSSTSEEMTVLGRISAAYGIKGWIKIYSFTDPIENIFSYQPWYLKQQGGWKQIEVLNGRHQGKGIIAQIANCETRNDAESYKGIEIAVPASALAELEDGEYYWSQLQGLVVLNTNNQRFGVIDHILETGANDVLVVQADTESIDGQERLIPYIEDKVVQSVDLETGTMIIDWDASW